MFPCPLDPLTGERLTGLVRLPAELAGASDVRYATFPASDGDYDTLQVAFTRRFSRSFFVQASFDYQWRDELRAADRETTSPLDSDPLDVGSDDHGTIWQNHNLAIPFRQGNTNWQGRILGRYVFARDVAVAANLRYQSGFAWAALHRVNVPGSGTQAIFLQDVDDNRSDSVTLFDVRVEKAFTFKSRYRLTGMVDLFNVLNSNAVTNFNLRTGRNFNNVIAALDPRTLKLGARFEF